MPDHILVMDGGIEAELARRGIVPRPRPGAAPLPVREPEAVRQLHLDAALAGAHVITAATGATHHDALARTGDARRAREWTHLALALARDAALAATDAGRDGGPASDGSRRPLRVAGLVEPLEGRRAPAVEHGAGVAASEHRAHAAILADGGADVLRIEGMRTLAESAAAARGAAETGLETWDGALVDRTGVALASGEPLEGWLEAVEPFEPAALLVEGPSLDAVIAAVKWLAAHTRRSIGATLPSRGGPAISSDEAPAEAPAAATTDCDDGTNGAGVNGGAGGDPAIALAVRRLVAAGATLLGPGTDGAPDRIAAIHAASERFLEAGRAARRVDETASAAWIDEGVRRAPNGAALWLGEPPRGPLPAGLVWHLADLHELATLPEGRYGLVVAAIREASRAGGAADAVPDRGATDGAATDAPRRPMDLRRLVGLIEPGGWLLVAGAGERSAVIRADERMAWLAPTETAPAPGVDGWIGRRRP